MIGVGIFIGAIILKNIIAFISPTLAAIIGAILGIIIARTVVKEYDELYQKAIIMVPYATMMAVSSAFGSTWPWWFTIFGAILLAGAYFLFDNGREFTSAFVVDLIMMVDMIRPKNIMLLIIGETEDKGAPLIVGYVISIGIAAIAYLRAPAEEKPATLKRLVILAFALIAVLVVVIVIYRHL